MSLPITIREVCEDDVALILNSWLKSYRNSPGITTCPNDIYFSETMGQKAKIMKLLAECDTSVACDPNDPSQVYGWATWELMPDTTSVIHYCYVKQSYRRQGIARALASHAGAAPGTPFWITHTTPVIDALRKAGINCIYNPFVELYERELVEFEGSN